MDPYENENVYLKLLQYGLYFTGLKKTVQQGAS